MAAERDPRKIIRRLNIWGVITVVALFGGAGGWAATSHLSGAVIGAGNIVVESNVKKVQHPTGGVVGQLLVREGSEVIEGQVVVRLDETVARATLGIVVSQLDELMSREARLIAERDQADEITLPEHLLARRDEKTVATSLADEQKLFVSRREARKGQRSQLKERAAQTGEEIRGLTAQLEAKEKEIKFIGEELEGARGLYAKNLVTIMRYTQLQRDQAKLQGERGQFIAEIARAKGKVSEIELQIIQLDQDFRTEVLKELREAQGKIAELKERRTAAEDQLRRIDIRAPQTGYVHQLAVHTVGGVISNGEVLMQIVPFADQLVVEAKIAPNDIDQVAVGATTVARIMAGNQRTMPDVSGTITHIAADLTKEQQTNQAYYTVRATLPESEVKKLAGLKLQPGMPVELFIHTHDRTPLQYLMKPLQEQISRAFRER